MFILSNVNESFVFHNYIGRNLIKMKKSEIELKLSKIKPTTYRKQN